jgi:AAA15 family ATPase/GTPase
MSRGSPRSGGGDSPLVRAFYDDGSEVEQRVDEILHKAFPPLHVKLDYTDRDYLSIRVSDSSFSGIPTDPRDAREQLARARLLDDEGDGIRSFCATVLSLLVNARPVLLLDEPEAFLHPPQAVHLGETIANLASESRRWVQPVGATR